METIIEFLSKNPWAMWVIGFVLVLSYFLLVRSARRCPYCGSWRKRTTKSEVKIPVDGRISDGVWYRDFPVEVTFRECMKCGDKKPVFAELVSYR
jgi:hypothetical protein